MTREGSGPAATAAAGADPELVAVLVAARSAGLLGPGAIEDHVHHTAGFAAAAGAMPASLLDLGSGGGVPGLVLARCWPATVVVLLDSAARRGAFLEEAVARLGLGDRVRVVVARAEVAGRDGSLRARFDVVTSRSFGPPPVTAECGAAFVAPDGVLLVSEPPDAPPGRWPAPGLERLGLVDEGVTATAAAHIRRFRRCGLLPAAVPRRDGIPAKRPLF